MSPRTREQNAQIQDERRMQILFTALEMFVKKGYTATKIGDIASAAHLSHGLVYHYFKSKDELYTQLVTMAITGSRGFTQSIHDSNKDSYQKIYEMTQLLIDVIQTQKNMAYLFSLMIQALTFESVPEKAREIAAQFIVNRNLTIEMFKEAQKAGMIIEGDVTTLVDTYFALINGLALYQVMDNSSFTYPTTEIIMSMLTRK